MKLGFAKITGLFLLFWLGLGAISLANGPYPLGLGDIMAAIFTPDSDNQRGQHIQLILWEIRLPRFLLAGFIGAGLGMAGASLQGYLRNPLAEPGVLGISSTAALFAVISFYSGFAAISPFILPMSALGGALVAILLIWALAGGLKRHGGLGDGLGQNQGAGLILAGVAVAAASSALTLLFINFAPHPWALTEILQWLMGSLKDRSWPELSFALPFLVVGMALLLTTMRAQEALTLGQETAISLGVNMKRFHICLILGAALVTGAGVAVAGSVGFVGLMAGHFARALTGQHPGLALPISGMIGAGLVIIADLLVRLIPTATEINLGVFTALMGVPFFFLIAIRQNRS